MRVDPVRSLIAYGGNIRVTPETFQRVIESLDAAGIHTVQFSSIVRTRPIGTVAGPEFLNAAALVETRLSASDLLNELHRTEAAFGRVRTVHWGPRTLDLDLLTHGQEIIDTDELVVPHPAMWYRRFVMDPVAEIAGGLIHPVQQLTMRELQLRLCDRPLKFEVIREHSGAPSDEKLRESLEQLSSLAPSSDVYFAAANASFPRGGGGGSPPVFGRIMLVDQSRRTSVAGGTPQRSQPRSAGQFLIEVDDDPETAKVVNTIDEIVRAALG